MLWFSVWTVLVLATLVGGFLLLRRVYRSGKALVREVGRAADLLADVSDRAEGLPVTLTTPASVDLHDPAPARRRREQLAAVTARRRDARARRHEATYARWRSLTR